MFRNQYDHDVSVWSPQGRIHQIEYAMEAVKQGSAAVALKSKDNCVIVALKRAPSELSSYQEKIIPIDSHVGMAITGLTADGFLLGRSMRRECADNKWAYDEPLPVSRLLSKISLKMQVPTQRYGRRPFGVGMLVTGFDAQGPHVYYLVIPTLIVLISQCPSSNAYDCKAFAVGSRSQSARTYLERHLDQFPDSSLEELIQHGLAALKGCLPNESELTGKNCALAVVGKGLDFTVYDEEMVQPYLDALAAKTIAVEPAEPPPAYVTSTQLYNWQLTAEELATQRHDCNAAARRRLISPKDSQQKEVEKGDVGPTSGSEVDYLTADEELKIVKRYILIMKALFNTFRDPKLPADVFGFAATYLKRFYLSHSVMDFFPREMMLTALYLACKAADFPLGLQHFTSHIPRNRERYSDFIVNSELFLMEALHYDLWIHTPYRPLCGLIVDLIAYRALRRKMHPENSLQKDEVPKLENEDDLPSEVDLVASLKADGYELIHTWYQTDLCLTVPPSQFALAVFMQLGRLQPRLGIEEFVKNEVCGCDPLKEPLKKVHLDADEDADSEEAEEADKKNSGAEGKKKPDSATVHFTPEQRWSQLSDRLEQINAIVAEFEFISDLSQFGEEEARLESCRNPLYDPLSEEYAAAKERANSLLATLD
ncbi:Proteasome subunit alpha 1 [Sparganum proliferum]